MPFSRAGYSSRRIFNHNTQVRVLAVAAALGLAGGLLAAPLAPASKTIAWADLAPLRTRLEAHGVTEASFGAFIEKTHADSLRRVREGDLDHLVFYVLQSTHFTNLPSIEPALSAKAVVDSLDAASRDAFLESRSGVEPPIPPAVRERVAALLRALDSPTRDSRLLYFKSLVQTAFPDRPQREAAVLREYLRAMRFLYRKEFVAQRAGPDAVAALYRTRGLSTDTAVEAGYVVYNGLGIVRALDPARRIRRVLIVGPGLDLAPRTGLLEASPPESYQPWAVIDALLTLGLSDATDLEVIGADINPRVVEHLRRAHASPPSLTLVSEIAESDRISFTPEFREYFTALGQSLGPVQQAPGAGASRHLRKVVRVGPAAGRTLGAEQLDVVTEQLQGRPFDLIVVTNVLPYFDDVQLMLAIHNIAAMLAPRGVLLHNEARPLLGEIAATLGLPAEQSRHAVIATVRGAPAPLFDSVWLHIKR
jgi:hypothetical protein